MKWLITALVVVGLGVIAQFVIACQPRQCVDIYQYNGKTYCISEI